MTLDELYATGYNPEWGYYGPGRATEENFAAARKFLECLGADARQPDDCMLGEEEDGSISIRLHWANKNSMREHYDLDPEEVIINPTYRYATVWYTGSPYMLDMHNTEHHRKFKALLEWIT